MTAILAWDCRVALTSTPTGVASLWILSPRGAAREEKRWVHPEALVVRSRSAGPFLSRGRGGNTAHPSGDRRERLLRPELRASAGGRVAGAGRGLARVRNRALHHGRDLLRDRSRRPKHQRGEPSHGRMVSAAAPRRTTAREGAAIVKQMLGDGKNDRERSDRAHLINASAAGVAVFLTRGDAVREKSGELQARLNIRARTPLELITELDEIRRQPAYQPAKMAESRIVLQRLKGTDVDGMQPRFRSRDP